MTIGIQERELMHNGIVRPLSQLLATKKTYAWATKPSASDFGVGHAWFNDIQATGYSDGVSWSCIKAVNNGTNNAFNTDVNTIASDIVSVSVLGGTDSYPNRVGHDLFTSEVAGDGTTSSFVLAAGFVVNDVAWGNISVLVRLSTGAYTATTPTVTSGYGTTSITVSLSPTPAASSTIFFKIIGENTKSGTIANQAAILGGYDNVSNKLMSQITGAHCFIDGTGTGHDVISGGSYHAIKNSTYSNVCGGTYNRIHDSDNATVVGGANNYVTSSTGAIVGGVQNACISSNYGFISGTLNKLTSSNNAIITGVSNTVNGLYTAAIGYTHTVVGNATIVAGYQHTATAYSALFGRQLTTGGDYSFGWGREGNAGAFQFVMLGGYLGKAQVAGERVFGHGASGKAAGSRQTSIVTLAAATTNATQTSMTGLQAATNIKVGTNCAVRIRGVVIALNQTLAEAADFNVEALIRYNAGTGTIVYQSTGIQGGNALPWSVAITVAASQYLVKVTGEAGKNIQWFGEFTTTLVDTGIV